MPGEYLKERKKIIDDALDGYLPMDDPVTPVIFEAVRYSVFAGGKRIRPILCLAAAEVAGCAIGPVLPVACALEMIHTYSLIHDDLPAMDDDDYRRGNPTSHRVFGEDMAILAGDALLTEAFHLLSGCAVTPALPPDRVLKIIHEIARAVGYYGMIGGQVLDLKSEGSPVDMKTLHHIHIRKTEALITVSLRAGAIAADASADLLDDLTRYGQNIGLAFQIADDILDVEGDQEVLGKGTGADGAHEKITFPALIGIDASRERARQLVEEALKAVADLGGRAEPLRMIARFIIERKL